MTLPLLFLLVSQPILELLTGAASALSQGNTSGFMAIFDRAMPGYEDLRSSVAGLAEQYDVASSIDFVSEEGGKLELDWFLELRQKSAGAGTVERRRRILRCTVEKKGKKWRVTALDPVSFFSPVSTP